MTKQKLSEKDYFLRFQDIDGIEEKTEFVLNGRQYKFEGGVCAFPVHLGVDPNTLVGLGFNQEFSPAGYLSDRKYAFVFRGEQLFEIDDGVVARMDEIIKEFVNVDGNFVPREGF